MLWHILEELQEDPTVDSLRDFPFVKRLILEHTLAVISSILYIFKILHFFQENKSLQHLKYMHLSFVQARR
jgi:hypothetical protein